MAEDLEVKKPASFGTTTLVARPAPKKDDYARPVGDNGKLAWLGDGLKAQIALALPDYLRKHEERFIRCLLTECQKSPKLLQCTGISLLGSLIQIAQLGLELGGPAGQSYIIPFKGACQVVVGYKGFIALVHRSDKIESLSPRIIYTGDKWDIEYGTQQRLVHVPRMFASKDEERETERHQVGYYTAVRMTNGGADFEFMTPYQAECWRAKHAMMKTGGPWVTNFDEMTLKTTIRKQTKRLPMCVAAIAASGLDEMADDDLDQHNEANVLFNQEQMPSLEERFADSRQVKALED